MGEIPKSTIHFKTILLDSTTSQTTNLSCVLSGETAVDKRSFGLSDICCTLELGWIFRVHKGGQTFMQAAGLTRLGDLGSLAGVGNRRGPCQNRTGSSFIDNTGVRAEIR